MGERTLESYLFYTGFCALYLGQALWAYFKRHRWLGKAFVFLNQCGGVLVLSTLVGAAAAVVKLLYFSEGHLGTSISGIAWNGPPAHEGEVFFATFALVAIVSGWRLVRAPAGSALSRIAVFFGPGLATSIAAASWVLLVF